MRKRIVFVLITVSAVAGCAPKPRVTDEPLPQVQLVETLQTDADRLLNYYAFMTQLQGETLLHEYHFVEKACKTHPNEFNRMQLIMLLSTPNAPFRNTELAHDMIKKWLDDEYTRYSKLRPLALLYENYLAELKRQHDAIGRANERLQQANERSARHAREAKVSQERAAELQDKLDALLEMERSLIEREQMTKPEKP